MQKRHALSQLKLSSLSFVDLLKSCNLQVISCKNFPLAYFQIRLKLRKPAFVWTNLNWIQKKIYNRQRKKKLRLCSNLKTPRIYSESRYSGLIISFSGILQHLVSSLFSNSRISQDLWPHLRWVCAKLCHVFHHYNPLVKHTFSLHLPPFCITNWSKISSQPQKDYRFFWHHPFKIFLGANILKRSIMERLKLIEGIEAKAKEEAALALVKFAHIARIKAVSTVSWIFLALF